MGNSLGCSPSGERLVSAARDGDLQEAQALLDFNPRLAKYSTFGVRNSPLHFAASQGHNEIVALLLESGVDVNIRNYCGQTALMQACRYGHWEVVQTLILYNANITRADYLNGRTALHFAAVNGHARCIRLLFADYLPSFPDFWNEPSPSRSPEEGSLMKTYFDRSAVARVVNRPADGGITALHMAALNGHVECVQLLLELTADLSATTTQDGTTIDLIGAGSTPLHYAACGGSAACCQVMISKGSSRSAQNSNGWTPLQVARLWHRQWLEPLLALDSQAPIPSFHASRYLALPLMSIVKIARDCGWRNIDSCPTGADACPVCLERKCTVASEGCGHELCTRCALYLCSTNSAATAVSGPPGSIPCPLCRHGIVAFVKLPAAPVVKEIVKTNMSLALCIACSTEVAEPMILSGPISRLDYGGSKISPLSSNAIQTVNGQGFSVANLHFSTCNGNSESERAAVRCNSSRSAQRVDRTSWPIAQSSIMSSRSESFTSLCLTAPVPKSSGPSQIEGRWWFHNLLSRSYAEN